MNFENTEVFNFENALRGMRNPLNSWSKGDSIVYDEDTTSKEYGESLGENSPMKVYIGPNDLNLAQRLISSGPEHAKFLRQIFVSVDITAPLYWWKEADTYKVGTTANSTSTMHKLTSYPITKEMFEFDDFSNIDYYLDDRGDGKPVMWYINDDIEDFIWFLESLRQKYLSTNNKIYWRALVQLLPQGWLQTRTWTANYAILRNIYFQRKNHKLKEWHQFCDWIKTLPYSKELITLGDENES